MASLLERRSARYGGVAVDVGGPCFDYKVVLDQRTCALLRRALNVSGQTALHIACDWALDETPEGIAARLRSEELEVAICDQPEALERNVIIVAADGALKLDDIQVPERD